MSWIEVEIEGIGGMAKGNEVMCANSIGEDPKSVSINGCAKKYAKYMNGLPRPTFKKFK